MAKIIYTLFQIMSVKKALKIDIAHLENAIPTNLYEIPS